MQGEEGGEKSQAPETPGEVEKLQEKIEGFRKKHEAGPPSDLLKSMYLVTTLGFLFIASLLLGAFFGYYLDGLLSTKPLLTLIFTFLGMLAGGLGCYRMLKPYL